MKTLPYVYLCTNKTSNQFYIGYRSANKVPSSEDLGKVYFTSSDIVRESFSDYDYQIIAEFFEAKDAYEFEQLLIFENLSNPLILNKSCYHNCKPFFSSDESTRKKIGLKSKGRPTGMKNIPRPDEVKEKIRQGVLRTLDSRPKYEPSEDGLKRIAETTKKMWENAPILKCPHCGKESKNKGNMNRHHFDKCKFNNL